MEGLAMRSELFEQTQHLHRRQEELEDRVARLDRESLGGMMALLSLWERLPDEIAELAYAWIELHLDQLRLAEELGPGWRKTPSGVAFFPGASADARTVGITDA